MANLPLAFGELLAGGVLVTAGISGHSIADVFAGNISLAGSSGGGPSGGSAAATGGAANPFGRAKGVKVGRADMGVDVSMQPGSPIDAPLPSRLVGIVPNWYAGQPAYFFQVTDGPNKGKFWYIGEQIRSALTIGQSVGAGEQVGTYASKGTGIEIGWAADAHRTLAQATSGYTEGQVTRAGHDFLTFLQSLGVK